MKFAVTMGFFTELRFLVEADEAQKAQELAHDHVQALKGELEDGLSRYINAFGLDSKDGAVIYLQDRGDGDFSTEIGNIERVARKAPDDHYAVFCIDREISTFDVVAKMGSETIYPSKQDAQETADYLAENQPDKVFWVEPVEISPK